MGLRSAITTLAGKAISGVTSFDLNAQPNQLSGADLPARIPRLLASRDQQDSQAFNLLTYDGVKWIATFYVEDVIYWEPEGSGVPKMYLPDVYTCIDNYLIKIGGDRDLGGALLEDLVIETVDIARMTYLAAPDSQKATRYHAIRFLHRWKFQVTGVA